MGNHIKTIHETTPNGTKCFRVRSCNFADRFLPIDFLSYAISRDVSIEVAAKGKGN